jgi:replicative superfamily II helicase
MNANHIERICNFTPDPFQVEACTAIENNENVLTTAHTGSGKTLIAEYAIVSTLAKGKKIIYTSPIKSLSNQKYYEFNQKYNGDITFGIITGDIKFMPQADVLIMTTEILRNILFRKPVSINQNETIDINIADFGCVIFDEVHYINDPDRGKVWEESMVLMPPEINMVMLSATIRFPEKLSSWIQLIKNKPTHLISNENRVVPLEDYVYHSILPSSQRNHSIYNQLSKYDDKLVMIKNSSNEIQHGVVDDVVSLNQKFWKHMDQNEVVSNLVSYMKHNNLLPALMFIFSRKKCEKMAKYIKHRLLEREQIATLHKKIRYYTELLDHREVVKNSHQYRMLLRCLEKGVAFHHGGMIPALKELVELLYSDGLIKLLFATETFAVGINMPTRTVVFSGLQKYDTEKGFRLLHSHEYIQMGGRAGRRGKDDRGYVIHIPQLYHNIETVSWKNVLKPVPQTINSKFNYEYNLILQAYKDKTIDLSYLTTNSLAYQELQTNLMEIHSQWDGKDYSIYNICREVESLGSKIATRNGEMYYKDKKQQARDKKKKLALIREYDNFNELWDYYINHKEHIERQMKLGDEYQRVSYMMQTNCNTKIEFLKYLNFMKFKEAENDNNENEPQLVITNDGNIATSFNEINPIIGAGIVGENIWEGYSDEEVFSLICSVMGGANYENVPDCDYNSYAEFLGQIDKMLVIEQRRGVSPVSDWSYNLKLATLLWPIFNDERSISETSFEFNVAEGNLLKHIWKFNNVCREFADACQKAGQNEMMLRLQQWNIKLQTLYSSMDSIYIKLVSRMSNVNEVETNNDE